MNNWYKKGNKWENKCGKCCAYCDEDNECDKHAFGEPCSESCTRNCIPRRCSECLMKEEKNNGKE